jgi:hypothetical protein
MTHAGCVVARRTYFECIQVVDLTTQLCKKTSRRADTCRSTDLKSEGMTAAGLASRGMQYNPLAVLHACWLMAYDPCCCTVPVVLLWDTEHAHTLAAGGGRSQVTARAHAIDGVCCF